MQEQDYREQDYRDERFGRTRRDPIKHLTGKNWEEWKNSIDLRLFDLGAGTDIQSINQMATINGKYFKVHENFKEEFKAIEDDADDYINPLENDDFLSKCFKLRGIINFL